MGVVLALVAVVLVVFASLTGAPDWLVVVLFVVAVLVVRFAWPGSADD